MPRSGDLRKGRFSEAGRAYLVTAITHGREPLFTDLPSGRIVVRAMMHLDGQGKTQTWAFVVMPDHLHVIAHQGQEALRLGQWIKALKAVVGGLERREGRPVGTPGLQPESDAVSRDAAYNKSPADVGRLPSAGGGDHEFTRIKRAWRWQDGYHDHKFRTPESETHKWDYVCLNPVRAGLVKRPEEWPFGGEIFYDEAGGPRLVRGTPPLLETGMLIEEAPVEDERKTPREDTRPTT